MVVVLAVPDTNDATTVIVLTVGAVVDGAVAVAVVETVLAVEMVRIVAAVDVDVDLVMEGDVDLVVDSAVVVVVVVVTQDYDKVEYAVFSHYLVVVVVVTFVVLDEK